MSVKNTALANVHNNENVQMHLFTYLFALLLNYVLLLSMLLLYMVMHLFFPHNSLVIYCYCSISLLYTYPATPYSNSLDPPPVSASFPLFLRTSTFLPLFYTSTFAPACSSLCSCFCSYTLAFCPAWVFFLLIVPLFLVYFAVSPVSDAAWAKKREKQGMSPVCISAHGVVVIASFFRSYSSFYNRLRFCPASV